MLNIEIVISKQKIDYICECVRLHSKSSPPLPSISPLTPFINRWDETEVSDDHHKVSVPYKKN